MDMTAGNWIALAALISGVIGSSVSFAWRINSWMNRNSLMLEMHEKTINSLSCKECIATMQDHEIRISELEREMHNKRNSR